MKQEESRFLVASKKPKEDLKMITVAGQNPKRRMYRPGYESYFNEMPRLDPKDKLLLEKSNLSKSIMQKLADKLIDNNWLTDAPNGDFARTIIAMESPVINGNGIKEGAEFVVAHWGTNFSSPIHGHAVGYMHEEVLSGKIRVNTYRMIGPKSNKVRLVETSIVTKGTFVSQYSMPDNYHFKRPILIHNFTAIEPTHSLHYLPEHTRDGRDNGFIPEYFEDYYDGIGVEDVERITSQQAMYLRNGDVVLVRSSNVPEYGDHYIVITGPPVVKEHGLRPQEVSILAPNASGILDLYNPEQGLILLKLDLQAKDAFHLFHGITMEGDKVIMPKPSSLTL